MREAGIAKSVFDFAVDRSKVKERRAVESMVQEETNIKALCLLRADSVNSSNNSRLLKIGEPPIRQLNGRASFARLPRLCPLPTIADNTP